MANNCFLGRAHYLLPGPCNVVPSSWAAYFMGRMLEYETKVTKNCITLQRLGSCFPMGGSEFTIESVPIAVERVILPEP